MTMEDKRFGNLDGLRAYACIGIVLMHVLDNGKFELNGFLFEKLILSFTNYTYLFMLLSAFSLCCGYYKKFQDKTVSLEYFYTRRYKRIWPYFAILCTLELIVNHNLESIYEWFADLTLAFGLIPNNHIEVVGVGWFLGTIFVFYMIFPFFVFLMKNKKRAWLVFMVTIILHILCLVYFKETGGRVNIIYSAMFFVAGGIIYLYRRKLERCKIPSLAIMVASVITHYMLYSSDIVTLIVFTSMTIALISIDNKLTKSLFQNRVIHFLGSISMEVYLCHMFVFRAIERIKLTTLTQNKLINYIFVSVGTIIGAMAVSVIMKKVIGYVEKKTAKLVEGKV